MNYTYISIFSIVAIVGIYTFFHQDNWHDNHVAWRSATGVISFIATIVLLFFSFSHIGETQILAMKAKSIRMGDEVIVQVDGWPVYTVNDIKYLDKPLDLVKTTTRNAWGCNVKSRYHVEIPQLSERKIP